MDNLKKYCKENNIEWNEPNTNILEDKHLLRDWIQTEAKLPWLKLDIKIPYKKMLKEAKAVYDNHPHLFSEHRYDDGNGWSASCIHGISSTQTEYYPQYGYENEDDVPYKWTETSYLCPTITNYFKNEFHYKTYTRLRIMRLAPGGFISWHSDEPEPASTKNWYLNIVNIALNMPKGCLFEVSPYGHIPMSDGSAFFFSLGGLHQVTNNSKTARYHIIVHGEKQYTPWLDIYVRSWEKRKQAMETAFRKHGLAI